MKLTKSIDLLVTRKCNQKCGICWGHDIPPSMKTPIGKRIVFLGIARRSGVKQLVVTGGEPLLDPDLPVLLQAAREMDLRVFLFTNGILLPDTRDRILPYVSRISLSLDGSTRGKHDAIRGGEHFASVLRGLEIVAQYDHVQTQVLTVVSRSNCDDLFRIGELLEVIHDELGLEIRWKLNQARAMGRYTANDLLPFDEFQELAASLRHHYRGRMVVRHNAEDDHDRGYLFICNDGGLWTPVGAGYEPVGSLETGDIDWGIIAQIQQNIDDRERRMARDSGNWRGDGYDDDNG